ncbi:MAG: AtpZ/AtpI family protein [Pseudomonadota bacterium]|nr:hypothetical protein [Magnetococcales bacterium]MEC8067476.1 AtpZ/AtpI family protein [Pseudomonadota bacterium]MEC8467110.1 AtpZ/AtpI family protein [Pseudomonadota bacterium]|tara:strand:- start:1117 stop:1395 length:279 start_codon:yes stop_codon:yes gene_type:complete
MTEKDNKDLQKEIDAIKSRYKTLEEEEAEHQQKGESDWSGYVLGLNLFVSVLVCTGIGVVLDKFFETKGLMVGLFVVLGFGAGLWQIWKKFS